MLLFIHITIALSSLVVSGVHLAHPTSRKRQLTYGLITATLISGTYLVLQRPAHLASACLSGLAYLAIVLTALALARRKQAREIIPY